jgi:single-stranded-DNA-specific exonuclease
MPRCRWELADAWPDAPDVARRLATAPLVVQVLHNRGLDDETQLRQFLKPQLNDLVPPELLPDIEPAAERIAHAVRRGEKITIYGDYDVDGMAAIAILRACLKLSGADVHYYVPHRLEEGYGLNVDAIGKIAADGTKLLVTVDCGVTAHEPVRVATAAGLDVIITDHHTPPATLPPARAIVHPNLPGWAYPNANLCGAGVAFKLAWQVARRLCGAARVDETMRAFLLEAMCLAALGTVADVVPLFGENRLLAIYGLRGLPSTRHPGLRALLDSAGLSGGKLDAYDIGFKLAPRLNACGRMGHAALAVELLTDASPQRAAEIAAFLDGQNRQRQEVERQIAQQACEMVAAAGYDRPDCPAIVLASDDWHGGVIGIVASRLVDRFGRPAVLIALNGDGLGHGSARSVPGFHIASAFAACGGHLVSFGGHAMAGGLKIQPANIDAFRDAFLAHAREKIGPCDPTPVLKLDAQVTLAALGQAVVEHLERLAPFGEGNPPPSVAVRGCRLLGPPRRMGTKGGTIGMLLEQDGVRMRAVGFGMGELADALVGVNTLDVAGQPMLNRYNGAVSVELRIKDVSL